MWGVGCIFVEMVTGIPTFPGVRDTYDQLDKIFKVYFFYCANLIHINWMWTKAQLFLDIGYTD